ncbi:MAG: RNA polymerase sigma factor [Acidobacteriia bacterium]|nr:RNA polymerase sigma factor [Terriglobia bacterium]
MTQVDEHSDKILLDRMSCGEENAFPELYHRHKDAIFRFAFRLLGSLEQAEDVTHDCFLSLINHPARFDARKASLRTYLYAAARNLACARLRRSRYETCLSLNETGIAAVSDEPLLHVLGEEIAGEVRKAISKMSPLQREVVVLFEYEEQSLEEIAAILKTHAGTIKSRLHRGREWLRRELAPYFNGGAGRRRGKSNHE